MIFILPEVVGKDEKTGKIDLKKQAVQVLLAALAEIPSYVIVGFLVDRRFIGGRKGVLNLLSGLGVIGTLGFTLCKMEQQWPMTIMAMIAKMAINGSFTVMYVCGVCVCVCVCMLRFWKGDNNFAAVNMCALCLRSRRLCV
jgi:hypothetical protein